MSKNLLIPLSIIALLTSACGATPETDTTKISRNQTTNNEKAVEIMEIGKDYPKIYLEKSGFSQAGEISRVTPEVMGKVTSIKVAVGQTVKAGETLIVLGDSLTTDLNSLNVDSATKQQELSKTSEELTKYLGDQSIDAAQIGVVSAYQNYENSLEAKENQVPLFEEQYQNGQLEIDNARLGYETAKENLNDLEDSLDDTEQDIDDVEDDLFAANGGNDPAKIAALEAKLDQLENARDTLDSQIDNAELAVELAENRISQSEIALEQVMSTYRTQFSQLNAAIKSSLNQYESAVNQFESVQASSALQQVGAASQSVQSDTAAGSAKISRKYQNITAPISGKITEINTEEGNLVSGGQILIKIENDEMLTLKTSVNAAEARFIPVGGAVEVMVGTTPVMGKVLNISPTLDELTKKVDLEIELQKPKGLPTGSLVKLKFPIDSKRSTFIPLNSIFIKEDQKLVRLVVKNGKKTEVKYQPVVTGEIIGNYIEIVDGITLGDKVITSINTFIEEGEAVKL